MAGKTESGSLVQLTGIYHKLSRRWAEMWLTCKSEGISRWGGCFKLLFNCWEPLPLFSDILYLT